MGMEEYKLEAHPVSKKEAKKKRLFRETVIESRC